MSLLSTADTSPKRSLSSDKSIDANPRRTRYLNPVLTRHVREVYHISELDQELAAPNCCPLDLFFSFCGDLQFVIGSILLLFPSVANLGACIFATGSVVCALAALFFGGRSYSRGDRIALLSQTCSFLGNVIFAVFSVTYIKPSLRDISLYGFIIASFLFIICSSTLAVLCCSVLGIRVFFTGQIPSYGMNFLGALSFMVGSILLMSNTTIFAGTIVYLAGSIMYLFGASSDLVAFFIVRNESARSDESEQLLVSSAGKRC